MASIWTCKDCGWSVEFERKSQHPADCPLCRNPDYQKVSPGKHKWISDKNAQKYISKGDSLENFFIQNIDLIDQIIDGNVSVKNCVILDFKGTGAKFNGIDFSGSLFVNSCDFGGRHDYSDGKFLAGATIDGGLNIKGTTLFAGINLDGTSIAKQLIGIGMTSYKKIEMSGIEISGVTNFSSAKINGATFRDCHLKSLFLIDGADFTGEISASGLIVDDRLSAKKTIFREEVYIGESRFSGEVNFINSKFMGPLVIDSSEFNGGSDFDSSEFYGTTEFRDSTFLSWVDFEWTIWKESVLFMNVDFAGYASFGDSIFEKDCRFSLVNFEKDAIFSRILWSDLITFSVVKFQSKVGFRDNTFNQDFKLEKVNFNDNVYFSRSNFIGNILWFSVIIKGDIHFLKVLVKDIAEWKNLEIKGGLALAESLFEENFSIEKSVLGDWANLDDGTFEGFTDFTSLEIRGLISLNNITSRDFHINASQIKNHLKNEKIQKWAEAAKEWNFLKNSFQNRNRPQDTDYAIFKGRQLNNRTHGKGVEKIAKIFERVFIEWGTGYGTKPENVFGMSFVAILIFAYLFMFFSSDIFLEGSGSFFDYAKYSFSVFSTLGTSNMFVAFEAFIGGFLMAMFTALLTRRIFRD